jgi:hypothetical protein
LIRSIFAFALLFTSAALNAATMVAVVNDRLQSFDTDTGLFVAVNWSGSADIQGNSITAGGGQIYGYGANSGLIQKYSGESLDYVGNVPDSAPTWLADPSTYIYGDGFVWGYNPNFPGGYGYNVETGALRSFANGPTDTNLLAFGSSTLFTFNAASGVVYTSDATTGLPTVGDGYFLTSGMSGDSLVYGDGMLFGSNGAGFINKYDAATGVYLGQIDVTGTLSNSLIYGEGVLYSQDVAGILQRYDASSGAYLGDFANFSGNVGAEWAFVPTVVPVPAAVWLFASALAGLGFVKRKRPGIVA